MTNEEKILDILACMQVEAQAQEGRILGHVQALIENEIHPKFTLLAEGQRAILDAMTPRSRVDDLEEEVKLLKMAFRQMNEELQALKKAQ